MKVARCRHIFKYLGKGCESITEDVSIVEPDITKSTATGEGESNARYSSRGISSIPKKGTKKSGAILNLSKIMGWPVIEKNKPVFRLC